MCPLVDDVVFDSGKPIEDHGSGSAFDVVERGLGEGDADGDGDGVAVDGAEGVGHGGAAD